MNGYLSIAIAECEARLSQLENELSQLFVLWDKEALPARHAANIQHKINELRAQLTALRIEYAQFRD